MHRCHRLRKITADGRPFIFKNRDASDGTNNSLLTIHGTKYQYVGVVNYSTSASSPTSIWYGHNEAGICQSSTPVLLLQRPHFKGQHQRRRSDEEGPGSVRATVDEFEALLPAEPRQQTTPVTLSTNFAVMDSLGNVAFFETRATLATPRSTPTMRPLPQTATWYAPTTLSPAPTTTPPIM